MAIALEFISFIVPRTVIEKKYPGGWRRCLKDHQNLLGGRVYFDDHLFRDGAMGPSGIEKLLREWAELGFEPSEMVDGREVSKDVCVVDMVGGKMLPCDWLTRPSESPLTVHLTGVEPGRVVGPADTRRAMAKLQVAHELSRISAPAFETHADRLGEEVTESATPQAERAKDRPSEVGSSSVKGKVAGVLSLLAVLFELIFEVARGFKGRELAPQEVAGLDETLLQTVEWWISHFLGKPYLFMFWGPVLFAMMVASWQGFLLLTLPLVAAWVMRTFLRTYLIVTKQPILPHDE